jgi:hypothetical protein
LRHQPTNPQREEINMKRSDMLTHFHSIIQNRLFGSGPWFVDLQTADALSKMIRDMRLTRPVGGAAFRDGATFCETELGEALKIDLLSVFMGLWDYGDIPSILADEGLIDSETADEIYALYEVGVDDVEELLKPVVQKAYLEFCRREKFVQ